MSRDSKVILSVIAACIAVAFIVNYLHQIGGGDERAVTVVRRMHNCINEESMKGKGQEHLDTVHRLCWMRAQRRGAE